MTSKSPSRVIAICLDGYEYSLAQRMMQSGELPAMRALAEESARFLLEHGPDLRTGLAGEHVATGLSAADAGRWAAVHFDPRTYEVWQQGTALTPFPAAHRFRTVVFDPPYFDLAKAPNVRGLVNWGAHDPGVPALARPHDLLEEIHGRFGQYPARECLYDTPWNSVERSQSMGDRLTAAARLRAEIALWLLRERLPDWDLALVTVGEAHSAIEGLWHGVDPTHPLHGAASGATAGAGVRGVYRAIDGLVGELRAAFPDVTMVVFSMHGMGANGSDAASMFLLGELLYRHAFHKRLHDSNLPEPPETGPPALAESLHWRNSVFAGFRGSRMSRGLGRLLGALPSRARQAHPARMTLEWMPVTAYRRYWPAMPAFALPSFYDGRVRINLEGREAKGKVSIGDYARVVEGTATLLDQCVDVATGRKVVKSLELKGSSNPLMLGETEADLVIVWDNAPLGFEHPELGTIGPVPYRRTGGHTGDFGFAYFSGDSIDAAERGIVSAYDVVPSILAILGADSSSLSGSSVFG